VHCVARLVEAGRVRRTFELSGGIQAKVTYDGNGLGYESLLVNGEVADRHRSFWWYHPHFEFSLLADGRKVPAALDVRVAPWLWISAIRLIVDGAVLYAEGSW
jgi:hypothetical protein